MINHQRNRHAATRRHPTNNYQRGAYFVTICTWKKLQWFGEVHNEKLELSALGKAAKNCWEAIPTHFPDVRLDAFVIMPDHLHGILCVDSTVATQNFASLLSKPRKNRGLVFGPQSRNLASVIRGFKIGVIKAAREIDLPDFRWQGRFHDRVIRSEGEFLALRKYVQENPSMWQKENIPWHEDAAYWGL